MIPNSRLIIEDLRVAEKECTRILDDLLFGIHAVEAAPIASSDAEGELRGYSRMCRVFVMVYRVQFYIQRAIEEARTGMPSQGMNGAHDA